MPHCLTQSGYPLIAVEAPVARYCFYKADNPFPFFKIKEKMETGHIDTQYNFYSIPVIHP